MPVPEGCCVAWVFRGIKRAELRQEHFIKPDVSVLVDQVPRADREVNFKTAFGVVLPKHCPILDCPLDLLFSLFSCQLSYCVCNADLVVITNKQALDRPSGKGQVPACDGIEKLITIGFICKRMPR